MTKPTQHNKKIENLRNYYKNGGSIFFKKPRSKDLPPYVCTIEGMFIPAKKSEILWDERIGNYIPKGEEKLAVYNAQYVLAETGRYHLEEGPDPAQSVIDKIVEEHGELMEKETASPGPMTSF